MLRKTNRISTKMFPKEERAFKTMSGECFSVSIFLKKDSGAPKVSVVVSKKVAKTAVARNKIRRRFYSILRKEISHLPKNTLLIFYIKKGALTKTFLQLKIEIQNLLKKTSWLNLKNLNIENY